MSQIRVTRRQLFTGAALALAGTRLGQGDQSAGGQEDLPPGRIAFVRRGDIWVWQGGDAARLVADGAASDPVWSPDASMLLYVHTGNSYSDLMLYDLATGTSIALTHNQSDAQEGSEEYVLTSNWVLDPDWSASGLIGFISDATIDGSLILWLMASPYGVPEPAASAQTEDHIEGLSLSVDGTLAAYTARTTGDNGLKHTYVALRDLADGVAYVLYDETAGVFDPAIAPDSQRVAVAMRSEQGTSDIWLVARADSSTIRVTDGAQAVKPFWSPDGRWLGYLRAVENHFEAWCVPVDGTTIGEPRRLFRYQNLDGTSRPSWTFN
jgi:Tol biopolymer transport system component